MPELARCVKTMLRSLVHALDVTFVEVYTYLLQFPLAGSPCYAVARTTLL